MNRPTNTIGWKALDEEFDVAVRDMCDRLLPDGFDVSANAPGTYDDLVAIMSSRRRMIVWSGASETTIYGSPDTNHAFRAWHDFTHWQNHLPFTLAGEAAVAWEQAEHLHRFYAGHPKLKFWRALLFAEVIGQYLFDDLHGSFPANQRAFVKKLVRVLLEEQAQLPADIRETGSPGLALEAAE